MTDQLTEQQAIDFAMAYNLLLSLNIASDYTNAIQPVMASRNANYALNKTKECERHIDKLIEVLKHEFFKKLTIEQRIVYEEVIENQKDLMYRLFSLDPDNQNRIKGLIKKLISEQ